MNDRLKLYYSIENGGDGSAHPIFFDTKELAEWHQEHLDEGWGEPCTGKIAIEGNNLTCPELKTKEWYYLRLLLEDDDDRIEELNSFRSKFFPNGLPNFAVCILNNHYYGISVEGILVYKHFAYPEKVAKEEGVKRLEAILNS